MLPRLPLLARTLAITYLHPTPTPSTSFLFFLLVSATASSPLLLLLNLLVLFFYVNLSSPSFSFCSFSGISPFPPLHIFFLPLPFLFFRLLFLLLSLPVPPLSLPLFQPFRHSSFPLCRPFLRSPLLFLLSTKFLSFIHFAYTIFFPTASFTLLFFYFFIHLAFCTHPLHDKKRVIFFSLIFTLFHFYVFPFLEFHPSPNFLHFSIISSSHQTPFHPFSSDDSMLSFSLVLFHLISCIFSYANQILLSLYIYFQWASSFSFVMSISLFFSPLYYQT